MKLREYSVGETKYDAMKWLLIVGLVALAVVGNQFYIDKPLSLRLIGMLFLSVAVLAIASQTGVGDNFITFAKQAKSELRKVVWPTRQEAIQTTFIVVVMVFLSGAILWCLDSLLFSVVGLLTS